MTQLAIDEATLAGMIREQFPHWADLPLRVMERQGWCNHAYRLGDGLVVRLPRAPAYAAQPQREWQALSVLSLHPSCKAPMLLGAGQPSAAYPCHWSVYEWIEGEPASPRAVERNAGFARQLAQFLVELHRLPQLDALLPGPANFHRGDELAVYNVQARAAFARLGGRIDQRRANAMWQAALDHAQTASGVWVHGDVAPGNVLLRDGQLVGVIDWGNVAVGDPACDLVMSWTVFRGPARSVFMDACGRSAAIDAHTWTRAKGWALWKAAILASGISSSHPIESAACWGTLAELLPDGVS